MNKHKYFVFVGLGILLITIVIGCKHPSGLYDFNPNKFDSTTIEMSLSGTVMTFRWNPEDFKYNKMRFLCENDSDLMDAERSSLNAGDIDVSAGLFSIDLNKYCVINSFEPKYFGCWNYDSFSGKGILFKSIGEPLVIENPAKTISIDVNQSEVTFTWKDTTTIWRPALSTTISLYVSTSVNGPWESLGSHEIIDERYVRDIASDLGFRFNIYQSTNVYFAASVDDTIYPIETPYFISF